jgi:hypothetical protein
VRGTGGYQLFIRHGVDEASLENVTVGETREGHAIVVVNDLTTSKTEEIEGDLHVIQYWATPDKARALGGDQRDTESDVVAVMFVLKTQLGNLSLGNREGETFARSGRTVAQPDRARG